MELSVDLPEEDVAFLDEYARLAGLPSRLAAIQRAINLLRSEGFVTENVQGHEQWHGSGDPAAWETVHSDAFD